MSDSFSSISDRYQTVRDALRSSHYHRTLRFTLFNCCWINVLLEYGDLSSWTDHPPANIYLFEEKAQSSNLGKAPTCIATDIAVTCCCVATFVTLGQSFRTEEVNVGLLPRIAPEELERGFWRFIYKGHPRYPTTTRAAFMIVMMCLLWGGPTLLLLTFLWLADVSPPDFEISGPWFIGAKAAWAMCEASVVLTLNYMIASSQGSVIPEERMIRLSRKLRLSRAAPPPTEAEHYTNQRQNRSLLTLTLVQAGLALCSLVLGVLLAKTTANAVQFGMYYNIQASGFVCGVVLPIWCLVLRKQEGHLHGPYDLLFMTFQLIGTFEIMLTSAACLIYQAQNKQFVLDNWQTIKLNLGPFMSTFDLTGRIDGYLQNMAIIGFCCAFVALLVFLVAWARLQSSPRLMVQCFNGLVLVLSSAIATFILWYGGITSYGSRDGSVYLTVSLCVSMAMALSALLGSFSVASPTVRNLSLYVLCQGTTAVAMIVMMGLTFREAHNANDYVIDNWEILQQHSNISMLSLAAEANSNYQMIAYMMLTTSILSVFQCSRVMAMRRRTLNAQLQPEDPADQPQYAFLPTGPGARGGGGGGGSGADKAPSDGEGDELPKGDSAQMLLNGGGIELPLFYFIIAPSWYAQQYRRLRAEHYIATVMATSFAVLALLCGVVLTSLYFAVDNTCAMVPAEPYEKSFSYEFVFPEDGQQWLYLNNNFAHGLTTVNMLNEESNATKVTVTYRSNADDLDYDDHLDANFTSKGYGLVLQPLTSVASLFGTPVNCHTAEITVVLPGDPGDLGGLPHDLDIQIDADRPDVVVDLDYPTRESVSRSAINSLNVASVRGGIDLDHVGSYDSPLETMSVVTDDGEVNLDDVHSGELFAATKGNKNLYVEQVGTRVNSGLLLQGAFQPATFRGHRNSAVLVKGKMTTGLTNIRTDSGAVQVSSPNFGGSLDITTDGGNVYLSNLQVYGCCVCPLTKAGFQMCECPDIQNDGITINTEAGNVAASFTLTNTFIATTTTGRILLTEDFMGPAIACMDPSIPRGRNPNVMLTTRGGDITVDGFGGITGNYSALLQGQLTTDWGAVKVVLNGNYAGAYDVRSETGDVSVSIAGFETNAHSGVIGEGGFGNFDISSMSGVVEFQVQGS